MTSKQDIRKMLRQKGLTGSPAEASAIVCQLKNDRHVQEAHTLLLYSALPDELSMQELIDQLIEKKRTVLLPRVINSTQMELRQYTGISDLQKGAYGIMEPTGKVFKEYEKIDVAIIPGMAFDRQGHRLGRGKGYYDRFLPLLKNAYRIGVCYSSHLLNHIPTDEHDIRMDCVVTAHDS